MRFSDYLACCIEFFIVFISSSANKSMDAGVLSVFASMYFGSSSLFSLPSCDVKSGPSCAFYVSGTSSLCSFVIGGVFRALPRL